MGALRRQTWFVILLLVLWLIVTAICLASWSATRELQQVNEADQADQEDDRMWAEHERIRIPLVDEFQKRLEREQLNISNYSKSQVLMNLEMLENNLTVPGR